VRSLALEIKKKFSKSEANKILDLLYTLEESPSKGKTVGNVGGVIIRELKYKGFRFYFVTDGFVLNCMKEKELIDLLMHFVRMSDKRKQQKVIDEIKEVLRNIGPSGFV
tara:strand:- start:309 stop:635 length:327 start_codon:yes stop_codon:yes gene_type:complete